MPVRVGRAVKDNRRTMLQENPSALFYVRATSGTISMSKDCEFKASAD